MERKAETMDMERLRLNSHVFLLFSHPCPQCIRLDLCSDASGLPSQRVDARVCLMESHMPHAAAMGQVLSWDNLILQKQSKLTKTDPAGGSLDHGHLGGAQGEDQRQSPLALEVIYRDFPLMFIHSTWVFSENTKCVAAGRSKRSPQIVWR